MEDKIVISEDEVYSSRGTPSPGRPPLRPSRLLWLCYGLFLVPVVGMVAFVALTLRRRLRPLHTYPALAVSLLTTLAPLTLVRWDVSSASATGVVSAGWKQTVAQRAQRGVVFIAAEEDGWLWSSSSIGTGVVVARHAGQALVLTNRHVVGKKNGRLADRLSMVTYEGRELLCQVVGLPRDRQVDMALMLVEDTAGLEVLGALGDYRSVRVGDEVVAVGHPRGLTFTMTEGIVSALREGMLIQCSASINPGNSGGPLIDSRGRLIGINTFIFTDSQGLAFAFRADFILNRGQWDYTRDIGPWLDKIMLH